VGDMAFQEKCIARMKLFKRKGVAIAFVSHNMQAVAELCDTAMFLSGSIRDMGPAAQAIASYVQSASRQEASPRGASVDITKAELLDERGDPAVTVSPGTPLNLRVTYHVHQPITNYDLCFILFRSTDGLKVYDGNIRSEEVGLDGPAPGESITVDFNFRAHLVRGQYHIGSYVFDNPTLTQISYLVPAGLFAVQETRTYGSGVADVELRCGGVVRTPPASE